jgi:hypothetical protein
MPCPPNPIELIENRCRAGAETCASLREKLNRWILHARTLLSLVDNPSQDLVDLLDAPLPDAPPTLPTYAGAGKQLSAYGAALKAWLEHAEPLSQLLEGRLCKTATLTIRMSDQMTEWPEDLQRKQRVLALIHLPHRRQDLDVQMANLRWALGQKPITEAISRQIHANLQHLEQLDDDALLRWLPDEE